MFETMAGIGMGQFSFCVGCKRDDHCWHNKDFCISQHLFVFAMRWADDPTVIERIEGRIMDGVVHDEIYCEMATRK